MKEEIRKEKLEIYLFHANYLATEDSYFVTITENFSLKYIKIQYLHVDTVNLCHGQFIYCLSVIFLPPKF